MFSGKKLLRLCIASAALALGSSAMAGNYPSRPITLLVPYTAGGTLDALARLAAEHMETILGQPVVVENKPGAGGATGGRIVANAKPDGYTFLMSSTGPTSIAPVVYKDLGYSPATDLVPVIQLTESPFVLVASGKFKGNTARELVDLLKESPGTFNYSSTGNGTIVHLFGEHFKKKTGTDFEHVPYPGGSQATMAMLQGDILFSITNIPTVLGNIEAGKLKAIATTGSTRSTAFPNVPTMAEAGIPDFDLIGWIGIFAPKGTPDPILEKVNAAFAKVMQEPAIQAKLESQGDKVKTQSVSEFKAFIAASDATWKKIARDSNVKID